MATTSVNSRAGARRDVSMERNTATVTPPRYGIPRRSANFRLAVIWGCSGRVARDRMLRCFRDAADVIATLAQGGEHDRLAEMMAPMDASLNAWKVVPPLDEATLASQKADGHEDNAEAAYHVNPCRETARALIKASAVERLHAEQREAALKAEWEL